MTREELAAQSPELVDALLAEGRLKAEAENKANMDKAAADAVAGALAVVKAVAGDETASRVETTAEHLPGHRDERRADRHRSPVAGECRSARCMRMPRRKPVRASSPDSRMSTRIPWQPRRGRFPRQLRKALCWRTPNVAPK